MNVELLTYWDAELSHLFTYITLWGIGICCVIGLMTYAIIDKLNSKDESVKSVLDKYNLSREEFDYIMDKSTSMLKNGEMHIITSDDVKEAARRISNREND